MLFNSFEFIFVFLPVVFLVYFLLSRFHITAAKSWLLASSLFFYSWWSLVYLPLLVGSLIVNFTVGASLGKTSRPSTRKGLLIAGILFNVGLLGFFKYYDFFVSNLNAVLQTDFNVLHLLLPLAISFYTFQQIAYLVDSYRNETKEFNFLNYALFISFFPQLIAGPIVHHKEVMGQYKASDNKKINWENISKGLFIFSIGLFKKVFIADTFAVWANKGYASAETLTFFDGWVTSLAYTFQLYYDFSGYTDMAIGAALLFNIKIPMNFNSPYKAVSIQDFWKRWHITLSRFLTQYIYIPLGGNRISAGRTYVNILIIFFISGFWHGAGWTFIAWGIMHGIAMVINRAWTRAGFRLHKLAAWFLTFQFINATWVFFRAPDFSTATSVLQAMAGLNGVHMPEQIAMQFGWTLTGDYLYQFTLLDDVWKTVIYLAGAFLISVFLKNSIQLTESLKPGLLPSVYAAALFIYSAVHLQQVSEFLYFNF